MAKTAKFELKWNLDDIVSLADFDKLYRQCERDLVEFEKWWPKLKPTMSAGEFKKYLEFNVAVTERFTRLYDRPELAEAIDQSDEVAKSQISRVKDLSQRFSESTTKISLWLQGKEIGKKPVLDSKNAKRIFACWPELEYSLNYNYEAARHSLGETEETIISAKDRNGSSALIDVRSQISTDQRFEVKLPGKKIQRFDTEEEASTLSFSPDPKVREAGFRARFNVYEQNAAKYFTIYQAIVKDWDYEAKLRGYASPIAMRNFGNRIPDKAIEVLLDVCSANTKVYQDYFRFKAGELGMKKLRRFDVYAPLTTTKQTMPLDKAIDVVLTTFAEFSPRFAGYAKQIIDEQHVDSAPGPQKRGGAFCATITSDITPYVMLNYTNMARDVSTLAHELGHGVHDLYAAHLPSTVHFPPLPVAETASTFGEMILFEKLLEQTKSPAEKKAMLSDKMSGSYATICRQSFIVRAEIEAHRRMSEGLTASQMGEIWLDTLHEQFGSSVDVDPMFAYEWAYIPHIVHTPFYCYAYNFGELLSLALFARYKAEGKSFVPKIEQILSAGGSRDPQQVLREVGIDMTDAAFWQGSFAIVEGWMKQLRAL